jgi:hypothetical protein
MPLGCEQYEKFKARHYMQGVPYYVSGFLIYREYANS